MITFLHKQKLGQNYFTQKKVCKLQQKGILDKIA